MHLTVIVDNPILLVAPIKDLRMSFIHSKWLTFSISTGMVCKLLNYSNFTIEPTQNNVYFLLVDLYTWFKDKKLLWYNRLASFNIWKAKCQVWSYS